MTLHEVLRGHHGAWPLQALASDLLHYARAAEVPGPVGLGGGCAELLAVAEDLEYLQDQSAEPQTTGGVGAEEESAPEVGKGASDSCESSEFDLFAE
jgi:hypothetical protein